MAVLIPKTDTEIIGAIVAGVNLKAMGTDKTRLKIGDSAYHSFRLYSRQNK